MTWTPPVPTLSIALDPSDPTTFTDLSSRIRGETPLMLKRGRDNPLDVFSPGQITVELDNRDRMLDPMNPTGLVYAEGGFGVPGCPVTLDLTFDGTTERRFTGRLAGECWAGAGTPLYAGSPRGQTVTLVAEDRLANSPDLLSIPWHLLLVAMFPDWWLPMDCAFPVLADGSAVPNRAPSGGSATLEILSGVIGAHVTGDGYSPTTPNLAMSSENRLVSAAADIMPTGDCLNLTIAMFWKTDLNHSAGQQTTVMRLEDPGGGVSGTPRMEIIVDDAGEAQVTTYNAGGTLVATDTIDRSIVSRWDDGSTHLVIARFTSGNVLDVWFGGDQLAGGPLTATSIVYESDLAIGPSDRTPTVDEVTLWRRALTDDEVGAMILAAGGYFAPWHGDNWLGDGGRNSRIERWFNAVGISVTSDDTSGWRLPIDDTDAGFWGIGTFSTIPSNFAEALRLVAGQDGAVTVNAQGFFVVRTVDALTDPDYAANYSDICGSFTDADTALTAPDYRHAGIRFTGVDADQVINRADVGFNHIADVGPPIVAFAADIAPTSTTTVNGLTSKETYGEKIANRSIDWYGWIRAASLADSLIARYAFPLPQVDSMALDATGDTDLSNWLAFTCDLEKPVDVEWTDNGITRSVAGLNIQSEQFWLTSTTFTGELKLAQS